MKKLEDLLTSDEALRAPLDQSERLVAQHGYELLREMIQAHYAYRAAQERPVTVTGADGIERDDIRIASRRVETPFGDIRIAAASGRRAPWSCWKTKHR